MKLKQNTGTVLRFDQKLALPSSMIALASVAPFAFGSRISVDDEVSLFRGSQTSPPLINAANPSLNVGDLTTWVGDGRWAAFLAELFIAPQPVVPVYPFFLFAVSLVVFFLIISKSLELHSRGASLLAFAVFCFFPTWSFILEFRALVVPAAVGILLTALAVNFSFTNSPDTDAGFSVLRRALISGLFYGTAIGTYQGFVVLFPLILLFSALLKWEPTHRLKQQIWDNRAAILSGVLGVPIYFAFDILLRAVFPVSRVYLEGYVADSLLGPEPLASLSAFPIYVGAFVLGSSSIFGTQFFLLPVSLIIFALLATHFRFRWHLAVFGIIAVPLAFAIVLAGPPFGIPLRALVAVPFLLFALSYLLVSRLESRSFLQYSIVTLVLLLTFESSRLVSGYAASHEFMDSFDRNLSSLVQTEVKTCAGLSQNPLFDAYGVPDVESPYPTAIGSSAGKSVFQWDGGNVDRIALLMRAHGHPQISPVPETQVEDLLPHYLEMRAWPNESWSKCVEGITLLKLGNDAGARHETQGK